MEKKTKVQAYINYKEGGSSMIRMSLLKNWNKEQIIKELRVFYGDSEIVWIKKNGVYIVGSPKTPNKS